MIKRSIFYASKLISASLNSGDDYRQLKNFIMINLLSYRLFQDNRCHRVAKLVDVQTHQVMSETLEIHFLELPKYEISTKDLEKTWISFLKDPNNEIFRNPKDLEE